MKNLYLLLIIQLLPFLMIAQNDNGKSVIQVLSSSDDETIISFMPGKYFSSTVRIGNDEFYTVKTDQGTPVLKKGCPEMDKLAASVIIPDEDKMQIEIINSDYYEINNINIAPSKGTLSRTVDPSSIPFSFDEIYSKDEFYPGKVAELKEPYILRDYRGQTVVVYPFQYNPVQKKLRVYRDITVKVTSSGIAGANILERQNNPQKISADFKNIYKNHFINYVQQAKYTPVEEDGNMLIICYGPFINAMQPYIQWKKQKGIPVEIVDAVNFSGANDIKAYVENYYNTKGLTYLLLVGDAAQIPPYPAAIGPSDNYYGYILGNDHYTEVFVGRFSAEAVPDVETQVERTLKYEKNPDLAGSWYTSGIGLATEQGPGDDNELDYEHVRNIRTKFFNYTYTAMSENYDGDHGGLDSVGNPTAHMILEQLNPGAGVIIYTGHGWDHGWGTSGFSNTEIDSLVNFNKLPFIWSVACSNGSFVNTTCFGEAWLRAQVNGKPTGAIGAFMSTISQYWSEPMDGQDEMADLLVESISGNVKHTFGGISMNGCMKMIDDYGNSGADMADTWTVFGDPSIVLRTIVPDSMLVSHVSSVVIGTGNIQVTGFVENALVSLTLNGEILGTGYINSGFTIINFPALSVIDTIIVTVTAYNKTPYIGHITITSPSIDPYVIYYNSSINDAAGNNNQAADYGENILLNVSLKNVGPDMGNGIYAALASSDPYITITDSTGTWGNIAANTESLQNNAFAVSISDTVPDQHVADFNVTVFDNNSHTWNSSFHIIINAPKPRIGTATIHDAVSGNGNGIIEPGETVDIHIQSMNIGHCPMVSTLSNISCSSGFISLNSSSFNINNLIPGDTVDAVFNISASPGITSCTAFDIVNNLGFATYNAQKVFTENIRPVEEDFETGNFNKYAWVHTSDTTWFVDDSIPSEGAFCAKSGHITHTQATSLSISVNVLTDDSISFNYKVSSELYWDWLTFYIDDGYRGSWSGEKGWARAGFPVFQGTHTFKWAYSKDYVDYDPIGSDCAWIDYILFPCHSNIPLTVKEPETAHTFSFNVYPNPAKNIVHLEYTLDADSKVSVEIFNSVGQKIGVLKSNENCMKGNYRRVYDITGLPDGIYFIRLYTEKAGVVRKFIVKE
ncbi:MAG: T9SS type A sorting domain-containing protein [Bacteroidia bacterium]|nr:T9SS type A sorting domain-containing protein [Bacteroidia bacterium]